MPEVLMPRLDPGMQSGKIVEWLKKEGDSVQKGQPILVVEGEKTTFEIEAPDSGILTKILAQPGADVEVSKPVAIIGEGSLGQASVSGNSHTEAVTSGTSSRTAQLVTQRPKEERVIASPAARRLAQEHNIDISRITGTGPGGRISREDILAIVEQSNPQTSAIIGPQMALKKSKLVGIRKTVAERLSFSARTAVPVVLTMEADATKLVELKDREHIGFSALAVKAAALALEKNGTLNSTIEGDEITIHSQVNVAVAIHTEQGLVAPVVKDANKKSLGEIDQTIDDLAKKAKENRLTLEELTGGTFTITNLGPYDVDSFAPVINPPQCAILGLGRVAYKPSSFQGELALRPSTLLTLVFDHRIVDGVPAARFLRDIRTNIEDANSLV